VLQGKYSPYPGDVIEARLEPGEFVINRNAVQAIGKDNLEAMNDNNPRYAQEGGPADEGIFEQNKLKLRRARQIAPSAIKIDKIAFDEAFGVQSTTEPAKDKATLLQRIKNKVKSHTEWYQDAPNLKGTIDNPEMMTDVNVAEKGPQTIAREKADALLHDERMIKFAPYGKLFGLKSPKPSAPPPPPSPLGDVTTSFSQKRRAEYLSTMPTSETLDSGIKTKGSDSETPTEKKQRWEERRKMIFQSKKQPKSNDMITVEEMAGRESGTEAQQLGFILSNYRIKDGGFTFDDFKMDHPVAYETLKKSYSRAFYDMQGEYEVMEIEEEEQARYDAEDKRLMEPHSLLIEKERLHKMQKFANYGLRGWETGLPRVYASNLIDNFSYNNQIDAGMSGVKIEGMKLTDPAESYIRSIMISSVDGKLTNKIRPDDLKERAQNLRHLFNAVMEERGLYSEDNHSGIKPEQISQYNAMIDSEYHWAMQGYQTPADAEKARLETEIGHTAREKPIKNMEEKKEPLSKKLKDFAGSLLFGQTGGYVQAYQEGGSVSLNNSRRLFNLARRKYV